MIIINVIFSKKEALPVIKLRSNFSFTSSKPQKTKRDQKTRELKYVFASLAKTAERV